jgi:hypothetical protein
MEKSNKRRHARKDMVRAIECTLPQQSNPVREFDCIIANISQSGLCLLATEALKNGQTITVKNHIFPSPRSATIRWSKQYHGLYYRYGLEFVEQQKLPIQ